jgi:hypothetical protein
MWIMWRVLGLWYMRLRSGGAMVDTASHAQLLHLFLVVL